MKIEIKSLQPIMVLTLLFENYFETDDGGLPAPVLPPPVLRPPVAPPVLPPAPAVMPPAPPVMPPAPHIEPPVPPPPRGDTLNEKRKSE